MKLRAIVNAALAAVSLPPVAPPKVPGKAQTLPGYRTQKVASTSAIRREDLGLANTDLLTFRTARDTYSVVRNIARTSPDLNASESTYLRVGIPEGYTMISRNMDGSINPEATNLAHQIMRRMTFVPDYSLGFNPQGSLQSTSEMLAKELLRYGACSGEVVLDKARLPSRNVPVSVTTLKFYEEDNGMRPVQVIGGEETNLDIPTFIYVAVDQDQLSAYSNSYFEAAIQPVLADADFTNDLRRVLKRAVHPRVVAQILEEKARRYLPPDVVNDPKKYGDALNAIISQVETTINGLQPEDALVGFDSIEYEYMQGQSQDLSKLFEAVQNLLNAKMATGSKTMPAVLGHSNSSNSASAETMLYLKHADMIRRKLNEYWSRAMTVSVRLLGQDVYVEFIYDQLDLRPDSELEAYKQMEQSRILMLLSIGMMPDDEACVRLTGQLPPQGYTPLAGTMFMAGASAAPVENPNSQTSTMNKQLQPGTPISPKSPQKSQQPSKANVFPLN